MNTAMADNRRKTWPFLAAAGLGVACLAALLIIDPPRILVWNGSGSMPRGLYVRTTQPGLARDDIVLVWLPPEVRALADARHYLPRSVPALKPVAAIAGDVVCAFDGAVSVNGMVVAERHSTDRWGRDLPGWTGCKKLQPDEVLLLSTYTSDSFDGRYFGPINTADIIEKLTPLWTF